MSSHHIVRDEQEPALLLWQPAQLSFAQAGDLLEWSPRVIVHQQALTEALTWGIKLDAVWAKAEEQQAVSQQVNHQQPVAVHTLPEREALAAVVQWLKEMKQSSLNLIADAEPNAFALLRQLELLQQGVQIQLLSQGWRYSYFSREEAQKWLPAGSDFRLVSFRTFPEVAAAEVVLKAKHPFMQEYQLQQSGTLKLSTSSPFWLGERV